VIESAFHDLRVATRSLVRAPGFSAVAVLTLAVAIGSITAIFSVVEAVLLRPLAYPDAEEIVTVSLDASTAGTAELPFSVRGYWFFIEANRSFDAMGGYAETRMSLTERGEPARLLVAVMTNSAFEVLGTRPLRGRLPTLQEDLPGGPLVVLLSHRLWLGRFGGDPDIVGQTIQLDDRTREVIGVMPPEFAFPGPTVDIWLPLRLNPESRSFGAHNTRVIARLRDDATVASAIPDAEGLIQRFGEAGYGPEWLTGVFTGRAVIRTLSEEIVGDTRRPLLIVFGTMVFVLLIACSNVANLFLVRAEARVRETALRVALGAGRGRIASSVFLESLMLAAAGGLGGVLLAYIGTRSLVAIGPASIPRLDEVGISATILLFTLCVSFWAGLVFGVLPALRSGSATPASALSTGGRGATAARERLRTRDVLVVSQMALALILLVGSGLMVRSFQELRSVDAGFDRSGVVTFGITLSSMRYPDADATTRFFDELLEGVRALPQVMDAGATSILPLNGGGTEWVTPIEDVPTPPDGLPPLLTIRWATPGYFETMRIPVLSGRTMEPGDHLDRRGQIFVSASLEEQFWSTASALGKRIRAGGTWGDVAGVVGDVHAWGLDSDPTPTVYVPVRDTTDRPIRAMSVAVRTSGDPLDLIPQLRAEVGELDPSIPLADVRSMESLVGDSMSRTSFTMVLLVLAAVVALFLGSVGIYGVISYVVGQRTSELGVRMALGAEASDVRLLILRKGVMLAATGVVLGVVGAIGMSRMLSALLFGVSPLDPITFMIGPVVFFVVAIAACVIPAQRAARLDPLDALRSG